MTLLKKPIFLLSALAAVAVGAVLFVGDTAYAPLTPLVLGESSGSAPKEKD